MPQTKKEAFFIGSALRDLRELPDEVCDTFGKAVLQAQYGGKSAKAKPMKGFGGAGVLEIVEDFDTNTYRCMYTVRFAEAVYVLHTFQKKSTQGKTTSERDLELIRARLKAAEEHHANHFSPPKTTFGKSRAE